LYFHFSLDDLFLISHSKSSSLRLPFLSFLLFVVLTFFDRFSRLFSIGLFPVTVSQN
jgi:hypothetical protein